MIDNQKHILKITVIYINSKTNNGTFYLLNYELINEIEFSHSTNICRAMGCLNQIYCTNFIFPKIEI